MAEQSPRPSSSLPPPGPIVPGRSEGPTPSFLSRRRAPAGSVPGTLSIPSDSQPIEIRALTYSREEIHESRPESIDAVRELLAPDQITWLDVVGFGDGRMLSELGALLEIHPLAIADIVHAPQRSKFESYGDRHLIILQMGRVDEAPEIDLEQVSFVLGPSWVVTFQERSGDVLDPVRERLRHGLGLLRKNGPDFLAYALADAIVDGFFPVLEWLGEQMEDLEERVLESTDRRNLHDIHAMRRTLIQLHRILWGQRDAVSSMLRGGQSPFGEFVHVYLRDTYDHSVQLLDLVETSRELTAAILEIHLSSVNNRMNEVMKTLTVMATIFIPLTFVSSVYGMNFRHMPELEWRWAYPAFWIGIVVIAVGLIGWFYRRGWLRRDTD